MDKQLALLKSDIRDLHQSEGTPVFDSLSEWGTTGYRLLELTLVLIFGLLIYGLKKVRGGNLHLSKGPKAASRRALVALDRQARPLIESPNEAAFYEEVAKVLNTWLEEGFGLKTFNRGSKEIAEMLDNAGLSAASIERILSLYETCNAGRFSPTIDTNRADTYALAKECFTLVR